MVFQAHFSTHFIWFLITGQESENQRILNRFAIWCHWSDMIVCMDKCSTFGIKKALTKSIQYLPKSIINNSLLPAIELGKLFGYLARYFDFEMSNNEHKSELISNLTKLMTDIDLMPLHPKNKIALYSRYVLSKLSWHLTVADLSKTWISENLDPIVNQHIHKWLEIPISRTLSSMYLTRNKFGLNIIPTTTKLVQCQLIIRNALKSSTNPSITHLWKSAHNHTNMQYDQYNTTNEVLKSFRKDEEYKFNNKLLHQQSST